MADLSAASAGLAQLQVTRHGWPGADPDAPCPAGPWDRSEAVSPSPLLQAAFGKGDLAACKQLLSRLKVGWARQRAPEWAPPLAAVRPPAICLPPC